MALKPGQKRYDWEIELQDTKSLRKYGLKVPQGSLQISTTSQDDTVYIRNVGKRAGDFDEQRSWKGGRGTENLSENAEGFWDSANAWTLTPGHVHQTLQWSHARGILSEDMYMPTRAAGDMAWQPLLGTTLYIANSFAASSSYGADYGYLWVRRKGSPSSSLTFRLMSNSGSDPNAALQTVTKTITNITDYISLYQVFDWTSTEALTSGVTYWVSVHASAADDLDNHWEVGVDPDNAGGKVSANGSSWSAAEVQLYFRVCAAPTARRWYRFYINEVMYLVDRKNNNSTASVMFMNGDRGKTTAGAASTLTDSVKTWTTNRWANAYIRIISGTGVQNEPKLIASNTGTVITIAGTWETNPDATSLYMIYATEWFTSVSLTGASLGVVTGEPAVSNNVAYIPQGTTALIHMRYNTTTLAHDGFSETAATTNGLADLMIEATDTADGPVIWRANNNASTGSGGNVTVSRANLLSSGAFIAWNTPLTFKTAIFTGSTSFKITGIIKKGSDVFVAREDGVGNIANDRYIGLDTGIEKTPDRANGGMLLAHGSFLYYSWLHSVVRVYGSSHDDIGDDYRSHGLPDGREGEYSDGDTYLKNVIFGINAGPGVSSVLNWDGLGWHETLRHREGASRIRMVKVQPCPGTRNRLWTDFGGGDLVFQELPFKKSSPILDSGARYMHEAVIESAAIDMGTAAGLPKAVKGLSILVKNLNAQGREIYVDYQTDENVHTNNWTFAGMVTRSPESVIDLDLENIRRFAYRLRIVSNDNTIPIDIEGITPNGYARAPFKLIWTMQISSIKSSRRGKGTTSDQLFRWLLDESRIAGYVKMTSNYELCNNFNVIVHPGTYSPLIPRKGRNPEQGNNTLVLQEA